MYDEKIETVDPQLKNNKELVEHLAEFESSWEKGKEYFIDRNKCAQLIHFSQMIEIASEKNREFSEQIECRDADIFISIPCLLLLRYLENDDKGICKLFYPGLFDKSQ
jgi:hypothetical protein